MLQRFLFICALLCTTACASDSSSAETISLSGKLNLRGNVPFSYPVVQTSEGAWQLEGIPQQDAVSLQGELVRVQGTVMPTKRQGTSLPRIQVQRVERIQR